MLDGLALGTAELNKGIIQGDAMSPLLFITAMEPLSRVLNDTCDRVSLGESETTRNHLIFIDDIKLMAKESQTLVELCQNTQFCLDKMGLGVNQLKSASNIEHEEVFGQKLEEVDGYKYLGILEDRNSAIKRENKDKIKEKILERTEKLCKEKLNARNLFQAINEYAISTINYYIGVIEYNPDELEEIDNEIRKILRKNNIIRHSANNERLYLSRSELGRGLRNIKNSAELTILGLHNFLSKKQEMKPVLKLEQERGTQLGIINEFLQAKYELNQDENLTCKLVREKQREDKMTRIAAKKMHSILFENEENQVDTKESSLWLRKGNVSPQEEGMLCKLQDRNLFYEKRLCPHCHRKPISVDHLATSCGRMLNFDYKKRHNEIVRCIHFMFCRKYGLKKQKGLKRHKVENVISNERVRIKSDLPILTENRVEHNKPDLLIHDLQMNEFLLIEVGVTNKRDLATVEVTKGRKYELLAGELRFVLTWDGLVTRYFKKHMESLGINKKIQAYIQHITLKRTCESIAIDTRRDDDRHVDYEELARFLDT